MKITRSLQVSHAGGVLVVSFHHNIPLPLPSSPESSDESSLATSPLRHHLPQSMKIVHEIMYKVEVLYVLCVLLMGRQRNQVRCSNWWSQPPRFRSISRAVGDVKLKQNI